VAEAPPGALAAAARNLLVGCAGLGQGQRLLLVAEDPALGWYDRAAPEAVAREAVALGATVSIVAVGGPEADPPADLPRRTAEADVAVYFARIGDRDRFSAAAGGVRVVSYARTASALASGFGSRPHAEMCALRDRVDRALSRARSIRIACPLGTDLIGAPAPAAEAVPADVAIWRFPMCVPAPVSAAAFSGRVALCGHLAPTGSRSYEPATLAVPETVFARIEGGRITGFDGKETLVAAIRAHHAHVAARFGIAADAVHSWHAGIHDGCDAPCRAEDDPDLWTNSVFGSPEYLHFHTCGDYPPGEICWMVARPTVTADGRDIWRDGRLLPDGP